MTTEQRLERLERENRWMRWIGAVGVAVVAAVFLIERGKDKPPPDLVVRSLTLRDENGHARLVARVDRGGQRVSLGLLTQGGSELVNVSATTPNADDSCGMVTVSDKQKSVNVDLVAVGWGASADPGEKPGGGLLVREKDKCRVSLTTDSFGPRLEVMDKDQNERVVIGADWRGAPEGTPATAESTLTMYDAKGNVIWQAPR
jgi:hypothetical protein